MGKNQSASGLTNIVQYDNNGNISFVSGSTTLMQISSSGAITTTGVISGSNALSASFSLNSGLLNSTGSVGFATTGSLLIISSSQQQISASQQQLSSSFLILTASFNAVSASQQQISSSQQQISASLLNVIAVYATTGSNSFRATQSITGSLTVTGQIIAQTLNVQQVTSSIIYSSGSNNFGCDLNSRQTFTGSVNITGSLTIAGASSAASYSGTTIYGSTAVCSAVGKFTSCIDAGSGTFSGILTVNAGASATSVNICSNGDFISNWIGNCTSQFFSIRNNTSVGVYLNTQNSSPLILGVSAGTSGGSIVNHLSIASGGAASFACSVGIGTTLSVTGATSLSCRLAVGASDQSYASIFVGGAITSGVNQYALIIDPQLSGTSNSYAIFANARIKENTAVTNSFGVYIPSAEKMSGATITNNYALYIANQTSGATLNYSIYSSGGLNYFGGATTFSSTISAGVITGDGGSTGTPGIIAKNPSGGGNNGTFGFGNSSDYRIRGGSDYAAMLFDTAGSERMRITSSGPVLINVTTTYANQGGALLHIRCDQNTGTNIAIQNQANNSSAAAHVIFGTYGNGWSIGMGSSSSSSGNSFYFSPDPAAALSKVATLTTGGVWSTSGGGTSDRRTKQNIEYIENNGINYINLLKPAKFKFKLNPNDVRRGFIAQDVLEVIPDLVLGDGDREDGTYGLDYDGVLALTVKAIQEQQCKIALLESCLGIA